MTNPTKIRIVWNHRGCGRCGGTGVYYVGAYAEKRKCWGCNGAGILMSPTTIRNRNAFRAWDAAVKPTVEQIVAELKAGRFGRAFKIIYL